MIDNYILTFHTSCCKSHGAPHSYIKYERITAELVRLYVEDKNYVNWEDSILRVLNSCLPLVKPFTQLLAQNYTKWLDHKKTHLLIVFIYNYETHRHIKAHPNILILVNKVNVSISAIRDNAYDYRYGHGFLENMLSIIIKYVRQKLLSYLQLIVNRVIYKHCYALRYWYQIKQRAVYWSHGILFIDFKMKLSTDFVYGLSKMSAAYAVVLSKQFGNQHRFASSA